MNYTTDRRSKVQGDTTSPRTNPTYGVLKCTSQQVCQYNWTVSLSLRMKTGDQSMLNFTLALYFPLTLAILTWRGVTQLLSLQLTLAPPSSSFSTIWASPIKDASCRTVWPAVLRASRGLQYGLCKIFWTRARLPSKTALWPKRLKGNVMFLSETC